MCIRDRSTWEAVVSTQSTWGNNKTMNSTSLTPTSSPKVSTTHILPNNSIDLAHSSVVAKVKRVAKKSRRAIRKISRAGARRPKATRSAVWTMRRRGDSEMEECTLDSMIGAVVVEEIERTEREFLMRRAEGFCSLIRRDINSDSGNLETRYNCIGGANFQQGGEICTDVCNNNNSLCA
eukprot:TRINITY_DN764_c0_g2_i1.p1 TRINITY_DN764_c0_g2~~TRINITY_DN764_c0_g2_i1.p1  ORF type:complete len:179 (-),score=15.25 TRINITY_DN764_c0_g2_i1:68-604(-)